MEKIIEEKIKKAFHNVNYLNSALRQLNLFPEQVENKIDSIHLIATKSVYRECAHLIFIQSYNPLVVYDVTKKIFSFPNSLRLYNTLPLRTFSEFMKHLRQDHLVNSFHDLLDNPSTAN